MASETLTFFFTDLEGSTRLWEEHGDAMRVALARHDSILRQAVEANQGSVVKSTGDGALATFRRSSDALQAAMAAQTMLWHESWPDGLELRVRMGLHAGEATPRDGDWFGSDVNRAARVMAVAHGGQILCTGAVREQVPDTFELEDLGEHRLRDLQAPVHLFQILGNGLEREFPPLRSLDTYRSNLPPELSVFIGRERELHDIAARVRASRIVSVVGVGGVGKTRVALHAASELVPEFADGVWCCELAAVSEGDDIPDVVAAAVGYAPPQGTSTEEGLRTYLARKELLLLLDNCEHLVGAVAEWVTATTAAATNLSVLTTSREGLGVQGEQIVLLSSLGLPAAADAGSVLASESGALFVTRSEEQRGALAIDEPTAAAIQQLCIRLDGIPLAIELAAAQTKLMTPTEIEARLDERFRLLAGGRRGRLERHQTLRAAIEWSFALLTDDERTLLGVLSVCSGGFDLDATAALAGGGDEFAAYELLASLVSKSLVERSERAHHTRYRLLEMIRQFAIEHLGAAGLTREARDRHASHYTTVLHDLLARTTGPDPFAAIEQLETETANVLAAVRWLADQERHEDLDAFFAGLPFLDPFAWPPLLMQELGAVATELTLDRTAHGAPHRESTCVFAALRNFFRGDIIGFGSFLDQANEAAGDSPRPFTTNLDAVRQLFDGNLDTALSLVATSWDRSRTRSSPAERAFVTAQVAMLNTMGDPVVGAQAAQEAMIIARATGSEIVRLYPLLALAEATSTSDPPGALAAAEECMRLDTTWRRSYFMISCSRAASILVERGDLAAGATLWSALLERYDDEGDDNIVAGSIAGFANALAVVSPPPAIEFGALAESGAVSSFPAFDTQPRLRALLATHGAEIAAARERYRGFDRDATFAHLRRILEELGASGA